MCRQPAQTLLVAAETAVDLFRLPVFQLVHPIRVCQKLAAHGGALDTSIEKLLLHKIRVVQAAHPANGEIGILTRFVAELEETTGMPKVWVVCRRKHYGQGHKGQTVKRAADNKRRYAPGWVHSTCLLRGFPKGAAPHLAHDFAEQSVVCYTLCRRCPENTVAAGEGKGI